jgi:branched-chain amino acid transport system ATP-binding protein
VERLLTAMRALPEAVTVVVVEHDFAFVSAVADTVTVLQDGKLLATGTPAEIAADAAVRAAYLGESGIASAVDADVVEETV